MSKIRVYFYLFSGLVASIVPILLAFGVLSADKGNNLIAVVGSIGSLIGAGAAGTAGTILSKQRKDPSVAIGTDAAEVVIANLPKVAEQVQKAQNDLDRVRDAVSSAVNQVPVLGPLASQVINSLPRL
jgi:hypothetical protein